MSYSHFSLARVKEEFELEEQNSNLFLDVLPIESSSWLKETLKLGLELVFSSSSSEKARSEFIVAPILIELRKINNKQFSIYSGERLDVDQNKGLVGECDFILTKGEMKHTIQKPIFALVEAKKHDIDLGMGQCVAQMLGSQLFNQGEINTIYGCVTTGEVWQFLKLEKKIIIIDTKRYYINEVERILGVLQYAVDFYK